MRRDEVVPELERSAFDFFFWFSRFEFALKENGYLRLTQPGSPALPGWERFVDQFQSKYACSEAATRLIALNPKRQVVSGTGPLHFEDLVFAANDSDLSKVIRLLKNVRNNLFHGGKHDRDGWSDPDRTIELLECTGQLLPEMAELGNIQHDFFGRY